MTIRIPKSATWPEFELEVANFAQAMREWRDHMGRVATDEQNGVTGIDKHAPFPRPVAVDLIDAAVDEDGNVSYEIFDDGPTAEQLFHQKRADLSLKVVQAEQNALNAVLSPAKSRLIQIREADILSADVERLKQIESSRKKGMIAKGIDALTVALGWAGAPGSIEEELISMRSDEENELLAAQNARRQRLDAINRIAAEAQSDIEDLTVDNIDEWKVPDFPAA